MFKWYSSVSKMRRNLIDWRIRRNPPPHLPHLCRDHRRNPRIECGEISCGVKMGCACIRFRGGEYGMIYSSHLYEIEWGVYLIDIFLKKKELIMLWDLLCVVRISVRCTTELIYNFDGVGCSIAMLLGEVRDTTSIYSIDYVWIDQWERCHHQMAELSCYIEGSYCHVN